VLLIKKGKLIAFARVLSDFVFKAEIYDVIVDKKYRNLGLGELLLTKIIKHKKLKDIKQFNLQCLDEVEPFYKKFGFKRVDNLVYMRRS